MSGRRYTSDKRRGGRENVKRHPDAPEVATPAKLPREKPKRQAKPQTHEQRIATAARDAAVILAEQGPGFTSYDDIRAAVIRAFAMAFAEVYGMPAGRICGWSLDSSEATEAFTATVRDVVTPDLDPEHFGCVHEALTGYALRDGHIVDSRERRSGGVHFTPRALTAPIVSTTLGPLIGGETLGGQRFGTPAESPFPPERTLELRVCDPAVGAGAFLLEIVRQLGARLVEHGIETDILVAKRLVAVHCCYGTDISRWAVASAKIALWLECRATAMPVGWLDDNIRVGDALVGLDLDQIAKFHWQTKDKKGEERPDIPEFRALADQAMALGAEARRIRIETLATEARRVG